MAVKRKKSATRKRTDGKGGWANPPLGAAPRGPVTHAGEIPLTSVYTAGLGGQVFFAALRDRGVLIGTRCQPCGQVYVPARRFCERCFAALDQQIEVGPSGTLKSFTCSTLDLDGNPMSEPQTWALVQLEGATTLFLHRLLGAGGPSTIAIGSQVSTVIKPRRRRTGSILDIEGFKLL